MRSICVPSFQTTGHLRFIYLTDFQQNRITTESADGVGKRKEKLVNRRLRDITVTNIINVRSTDGKKLTTENTHKMYNY